MSSITRERPVGGGAALLRKGIGTWFGEVLAEMLEEDVVSAGMLSELTPEDDEESMVMVLLPLEFLLLLILL